MDEENNSNVPSIDILNDDCLIHIFTFLRVPDRVRIERVCKRWQTLTKLSWRKTKKLTLLSSSIHIEHVYEECIDADAQALQKVLQLCGRYLTCIHFELNLIRSSESILSNILCQCRFQNLDELIIRIINPEDKIFDDKSLQAIAQGCVKLTKLRIFGAKAITDVGFTCVAKLLPIESLSLCRVNISGKGFSDMKSLKELFCYYCPHISNEILTTLIETSQNVGLTELIRCQAVNPWGLIDSLKKSPRHYLLVYTCSDIGSDKLSMEKCTFTKKDNRLSINVESKCSISIKRRTECKDGCSICGMREYIDYIE